MNMYLHPKLQERIKEWSIQEYPNEVCGLIVAYPTGDIGVRKCKNVSPDKRNAFAITDEDLQSVKKEAKVVGVFHSHPRGNAEISETDKQISEAYGLPYVVYCGEDKFISYTPLGQSRQNKTTW